jgi:hypothetical protein
MSDAKDTIGIAELLDEIARDLDDYRKKHPNDYSLKSVTLWWDMEKERLTMRHSPSTLVKKIRRVQGFKQVAIWFLAGGATMLAANTVINLLLP